MQDNRCEKKPHLVFQVVATCYLSLCLSPQSKACGNPVALVEGRTNLSVVLATSDSETLLAVVFDFWRKLEGQFPIIVAMEPGPLDLIAGLRLLPNEVVPKLSLPHLLLISNLGQLQFKDSFLAFVRRCLSEGIPVWVVGAFSVELLEVGLEPGWQIQRVPLNKLGEELQAWCENGS